VHGLAKAVGACVLAFQPSSAPTSAASFAVSNFAARGAAEGDVKAATSGAMGSRRRDSMNDVGWRIWPTNFGNGAIHQLAPYATSIGWWRVGPRDQPYGRFARGFERATNRSAMGFVLDQRLWGGLPLAQPPPPVVLRIVYFAHAPASLSLSHDATGGCSAPRAIVISAKEAGRWQELTLTLDDARFGRGCAGVVAASGEQGSDVLLRATSDADALVHSLEIYRPELVP
jgi:hypothetical protein